MSAKELVKKLVENEEADEFLRRHVTEKPLPKEIRIVGRRWFQRTYGNTYHVAYVYVDGVLVYTSPRHYGYGEQYEETGWSWLEDNNVIPKRHSANGGYEAPWRQAEDLGIKYSRESYDVKRQKDL